MLIVLNMIIQPLCDTLEYANTLWSLNDVIPAREPRIDDAPARCNSETVIGHRILIK